MTALAGTKGARRAVARGLSLGKRAKVVALLKKLAPAKSKADFVAEADCLVGSQGLAHINDLPRLKDCSSKKAADEARRLARLANNLRRHIKTMHETAIEVVNEYAKRHAPLVEERHVHVLLVEDDMERLELAASAAAKAIELGPQNKDGMGPPEKKAAKQLTTVAASVFQRVSRHPATDPKFSRFLGDLFEVLGEEARAQGQVKLMKISRQKNRT